MIYDRWHLEAFTTIAVKAAQEHDLAPEDAIRFADYSCASVGDASVDEDDFDRHFDDWLLANEPSWRDERLTLWRARNAVGPAVGYDDLVTAPEFRRLTDLIAKAEEATDSRDGDD